MIHQRLMNCTEARMMEFLAKILVVVLVSVISWFGFRFYRCKADRERNGIGQYHPRERMGSRLNLSIDPPAYAGGTDWFAWFRCCL